jgi:HSP20 family protein
MSYRLAALDVTGVLAAKRSRMRSSTMRSRIHTIAFPSEIGEFAEDVRRVFLALGRAFGPDSLAGECAPPVDVYETDDTLEITVDLPGVDSAAVRVIGKGDSLLMAGEKSARRAGRESSFHLVERGYGRFARVVRLGRACDTSKARATLVHGELRISVPKIADRRGRAIQITVNG